MKNVWKVLWVEEGKKRKKYFEGDPGMAELRGTEPLEKPLEVAVAFAKELKAAGFTPEVVSARKAFIQQRDKPKPHSAAMWCPYCIKWREFKILRIRRKFYVGTPAVRCPTCTISEDDFWVKKYNGRLENLSAEEIRRYYKRDRKLQAS